MEERQRGVLTFSIKWLVQIIVIAGTAVYMYLGLEHRVNDIEKRLEGVAYHQNTHVFPKINLIEADIVDLRMERERIKKDIEQLRGYIKK